jgi:hypothetical protein
MHSRFSKFGGSALALCGAVLLAGSLAFAQEAKTPRALAIVLDDEAPQTNVRYRTVTALAQGAGVVPVQVRSTQIARPGEYWIGVQLRTLDELTLSQLKLKQGVAAEDVIADSPAAKAGVQKHDVLLQFGDAPINTPDDLIAAVEKAKETSVDLKVLREGKEQVIRIAPAKRAKQESLEVEIAPKGDELRRIEAWVKKLHSGEGGADPLQLHVIRPGVMLHGTFKTLDYPKDLSISITKQGNDPAKISVKRGDKSWEVTADKISDLPADVRPYVEGLLVQHGAAPMRYWLDVEAKKGMLGGLKVAPVAPVPALPGVPGGVSPPLVLPRIQVREYRSAEQQSLDAVQKELQALLKKVEDMRASKAANPADTMKREIDQLRKELEELRKASGKQ